MTEVSFSIRVDDVDGYATGETYAQPPTPGRRGEEYILAGSRLHGNTANSLGLQARALVEIVIDRKAARRHGASADHRAEADEGLRVLVDLVHAHARTYAGAATDGHGTRNRVHVGHIGRGHEDVAVGFYCCGVVDVRVSFVVEHQHGYGAGHAGRARSSNRGGDGEHVFLRLGDNFDVLLGINARRLADVSSRVAGHHANVYAWRHRYCPYREATCYAQIGVIVPSRHQDRLASAFAAGYLIYLRVITNKCMGVGGHHVHRHRQLHADARSPGADAEDADIVLVDRGHCDTLKASARSGVGGALLR